nr:hypothetical protein Itr_chr14CG15630 [Ipomoea trifida]
MGLPMSFHFFNIFIVNNVGDILHENMRRSKEENDGRWVNGVVVNEEVRMALRRRRMERWTASRRRLERWRWRCKVAVVISSVWGDGWQCDLM